LAGVFILVLTASLAIYRLYKTLVEYYDNQINNTVENYRIKLAEFHGISNKIVIPVDEIKITKRIGISSNKCLKFSFFLLFLFSSSS
jgi:hypothetical protein